MLLVATSIRINEKNILGLSEVKVLTNLVLDLPKTRYRFAKLDEGCKDIIFIVVMVIL
jgi:hypothetical protein